MVIMDGLMDSRREERKGKIERRRNEWMEGRIDGQTDGKTNRQMDG